MASVDQRATIDDLYRFEGKAELIDGRLVSFMPTGRRPNRVAFRIVRSLDDHAIRTGRGEAYTDNMGFTVPRLSSGRRSFSPDGAYYDGPFSDDTMRFIDGPPTFAVEVRSEGDYGPTAEQEMAARRADYFEAGTLAVWDVDPGAQVVRVYRAAAAVPAIYGPGEVAEAEPAVPGWRILVDEIFAD